MKRFLLLLSLAVCSASPASGGQLTYGVGFLAGMDFPILQQDQAAGTVYGIRLHLQAINGLIVEPHLTFTSYDSPI
ncbi:MAG: hypothetical protein V3T31_06990, partial [candidate division Zixibacteria bacterium]